MKEGTVLEQTRRWALWVALGSATAALVIGVLAIWGAISLVTIPSIEDILAPIALQGLGAQLGDQMGMDFPPGLMDAFGGFDIPGPEITAWGKLLATFSTLLATAGSVLLSLLVASHVKK